MERFILPRLAWLLLRPSTVIILMGLLGVVLLWSGRPVWGRVLASLSVAALVVCLLVPVDELVLLPLEARFPRPERLPDHIDGIIALGGAVNPYLTEQHGIPSLNDTAERMTAFVALARQHPEAALAFTGGNGQLVGASLSEADVARALFTSLGLDRPVLYEGQSRSTYENALFLKQKVQPTPGQVWVVITSAAHMPRSIGTFRAAGWPVIAWPVAYKVGRTIRFDLETSAPQRLGELDTALHEWAGLVGYWLTGRTKMLFPAPQ